MTNTDNAFVQGMLKQAAEIDRTLQKQAYGKRLTALLQRKGKLPMESKPNVGVSSFPTTKQAFDSLFPLAGGLMGYSKENPVAGPVVGALAGYGAEKAWNSDAVRDAIGKGIDAVPGLRDFAVDHPLLAGASAGLAGAGLGAGIYAGVKKLNNRFSSPSPATKQADTFLPYTLLQEQLGEASQGVQDYLHRAGQGIQGVVDRGTAALGRGVDAVRNTAERVGDRVGDMAAKTEDALFETPTERFFRHSKNNIEDFQQTGTGKMLSNLLQGIKGLPESHPTLTSGAVGAGVGGLAGAMTGKGKNKETGEKGTRGRNALLGALLGGGAGAGIHAMAEGPISQALLKARF